MLRAGQRSSRQVSGSILVRYAPHGYQYWNLLEGQIGLNYTKRSARALNRSWMNRRDIHTETKETIYIHDTSGKPGFESDVVTLGLLSSLAKFKPGLGYFCPIDRCTRRGNRSDIMKDILKSHGGIPVTKGVTMARAYELMTNDRRDDLLEEILRGVHQQTYINFNLEKREKTSCG
eukprot:Gb_37256 [translate_table: standard]